MKDHELRYSHHYNPQNGFVSYVVIALLTVVIILLLGVFFFAPETITKFNQTAFNTTSDQKSDGPDNTGTGNSDPGSSADQSVQLTDTNPAGLSMTSTEPELATTTAADDTDDKQGLVGSGKSLDAETYDLIAEDIGSFFVTLDSRDYIKDFQLESPSDVYFPSLIQNLVNHPPVVSGETDDLFTILQNTAHFFRILGKKNILLLKGILDRERDTFEQTLADFYRLTDDPKSLEEHFNLTIGQEEMYAYAGFFLNTMGGRLYLFRRDSMSRMVVSFYAVKIVDRANQEGRNKYGIEIKDAIDNLILEIESSRIKLKMRDDYLDTLYDLKVKYQ